MVLLGKSIYITYSCSSRVVRGDLRPDRLRNQVLRTVITKIMVLSTKKDENPIQIRLFVLMWKWHPLRTLGADSNISVGLVIYASKWRTGIFKGWCFSERDPENHYVYYECCQVGQPHNTAAQEKLLSYVQRCTWQSNTLHKETFSKSKVKTLVVSTTSCTTL